MSSLKVGDILIARLVPGGHPWDHVGKRARWIGDDAIEYLEDDGMFYWPAPLTPDRLGRYWEPESVSEDTIERASADAAWEALENDEDEDAIERAAEEAVWIAIENGDLDY